MSKAATRGQALELIARFAINTRWGEIDSERAQRIVDLPTDELGRRYTAFLSHMFPKLFEEVGTVQLRAENFNVSEHFRINKGGGVDVPIGDIDENFEALFGEIVEHIEEADPDETEVQIFRLLSSPHGKTVTEEIRYLEGSPIPFSIIWKMMEQRSGPSPAILDNAWSYVFYVYDRNKKPWYLVVYWNSIQHYWALRLQAVTASERFQKGEKFFFAT